MNGNGLVFDGRLPELPGLEFGSAISGPVDGNDVIMFLKNGIVQNADIAEPSARRAMNTSNGGNVSAPVVAQNNFTESFLIVVNTGFTGLFA